jgi:tripartite-type tricarboxylate transporter receptor subunit TctC
VPLGLIISVKPGVDADSKTRLAKLIDMCSRDPAVKTFLDQNFGKPVQMSGDEIRSLVRKYATHQF